MTDCYYYLNDSSKKFSLINRFLPASKTTWSSFRHHHVVDVHWPGICQCISNWMRGGRHHLLLLKCWWFQSEKITMTRMVGDEPVNVLLFHSHSMVVDTYWLLYLTAVNQDDEPEWVKVHVFCLPESSEWQILSSVFPRQAGMNLSLLLMSILNPDLKGKVIATRVWSSYFHSIRTHLFDGQKVYSIASPCILYSWLQWLGARTETIIDHQIFDGLGRRCHQVDSMYPNGNDVQANFGLWTNQYTKNVNWIQLPFA